MTVLKSPGCFPEICILRAVSTVSDSDMSSKHKRFFSVHPLKLKMDMNIMNKAEHIN